jgi:uncharacterized protein YbbC (DUF1343 family)
MVGDTHLVDTLISSGICVKKIFCPEHGFRGTADAGEIIVSSTDKKTGLPVISLYGKNKKPRPNLLGTGQEGHQDDASNIDPKPI